jgi:hypothetical protein
MASACYAQELRRHTICVLGDGEVTADCERTLDGRNSFRRRVVRVKFLTLARLLRNAQPPSALRVFNFLVLQYFAMNASDLSEEASSYFGMACDSPKLD